PSKLERQRNLARMLSRKTDLEKGRDSPNVSTLALRKAVPKPSQFRNPDFNLEKSIPALSFQ
ncbi:hypothetical protein RRG08_051577, partial [Elysia crispata]